MEGTDNTVMIAASRPQDTLLPRETLRCFKALFLLVFPLCLSTFLSLAAHAQGHWLSGWGGASATHYSPGKSDITYRSELSPVVGLRYGHDLGSTFRFCSDVRYSVRRYEESMGSPRDAFNVERAYDVREWTVALLGAVRVAAGQRSETRILPGLEFILPRSATVDIRSGPVGREGPYAVRAPQAFGLGLGIRHAHRCTDLLWFFAEFRVVRAYSIGTAETRLPGGGTVEVDTAARMAALLSVGIEIGHSQEAAMDRPTQGSR
jgi:hypothetical protein